MKKWILLHVFIFLLMVPPGSSITLNNSDILETRIVENSVFITPTYEVLNPSWYGLKLLLNYEIFVNTSSFVLPESIDCDIQLRSNSSLHNFCLLSKRDAMYLQNGNNSFSHELSLWDYPLNENLSFKNQNYTFSIWLPSVNTESYSGINATIEIENNRTKWGIYPTMAEWENKGFNLTGAITRITTLQFRLIPITSIVKFSIKAEAEIWNPTNEPVRIGGGCICYSNLWIIPSHFYNYSDNIFWHIDFGGYQVPWSKEVTPGFQTTSTSRTLSVFNWNTTILANGNYELFYDPNDDYFFDPSTQRPKNYLPTRLEVKSETYFFDYSDRPSSWNTEISGTIRDPLISTTSLSTQQTTSTSDVRFQLPLLEFPVTVIILVQLSYWYRRKNHHN